MTHVPQQYDDEAEMSEPPRPASTTRTLELPYPPSVNNYWKWGRGRMRISEHGEAFRLEVMSIASSDKSAVTMRGALRVGILVYPPDQRKRDLDNILKSLLDALQHAKVYQDDSQIVNLRMKRQEVVPEGMVRVFVESEVSLDATSQ